MGCTAKGEAFCYIRAERTAEDVGPYKLHYASNGRSKPLPYRETAEPRPRPTKMTINRATHKQKIPLHNIKPGGATEVWMQKAVLRA